ncbi:MAG: Hsp33 family molecular chaperone HslO [Pseudomonadota bacterium]
MIKDHPYGDDIKAQLKAAALDRLHRFVLSGGTVRGAVLHGTRMVNEMRANHGLGILETLVLGHAYLAGGLMTSHLKGNDRIRLAVDCTGPIKGLTVEVNAFGEVRGHLKSVPIAVDKPLESFNLSPFFGAGVLEVTRFLEDAKNPFTGRVALMYGSLAKDLAYYFLTSEQIPSAFHLSIKFDTEGTVTGAGGLFLQVLPGAPEDTVASLESLVAGISSIGEAFESGIPAETVIADAFRGHDAKILDSYRVEFFCHCGLEKIRNMLAMLPEDDLRDIRENGPFPVDIQCHHCSSHYQFSQADVVTIYNSRYSPN